MRNWTQLRETYKAILEAELLKGKSAILRQAELAARRKPLAVQALRRVERLGGFQQPHENEDITGRVARELLNAPHPTGTTRNPVQDQGIDRSVIRGSKQERSEAAGRAQAEQIATELAAERAARLKAAKKNRGTKTS